MSYHDKFNEEGTDDDQTGAFQEFRTADSLTDWLTSCREKCESQRLRWFLKDFELYCQYEIGAQTMITDIDRRTILENLNSKPEHVTIAKAVHDSWPDIQKSV